MDKFYCFLTACASDTTVVISPVMAQGPNTTLAQNRNNTKLVVDFKNHTISIIDTITNETISVKQFYAQ